jgi:hypothetical protein
LLREVGISSLDFSETRTPVPGSTSKCFDRDHTHDVAFDEEHDRIRKAIEKYAPDRETEPDSRVIDADESFFQKTAVDRFELGDYASAIVCPACST